MRPVSVDLSDINNDGYLDVLALNSIDTLGNRFHDPEDSVDLSVFYGQGDGSFSNEQIFHVGDAPRPVLAIADLSSDGFDDLVFAPTTSGENLYLAINGQSPGTSVILPAQAQTQYTYDPTFNQITSMTDSLGRQILYEIDPNNGNMLSETRVVGELGGNDDQISRYTYTSSGQIDRIIDPLGRITDYDYNALGRVIQVTFALGTDDEAIQQFDYDDAGNLTLFIDENGNRTQYLYDPLNRLRQLTEADPDGDDPLTSPVTIYIYDKNGNLKTVEDARSNLTTYEYDELDRQTIRIDALVGVMRYEYDKFGNVTTETDERGHTTHYRYDTRNRLIETVDPEGAVVQFFYDTNDNLIRLKEYLTDIEFRETHYVYDVRNRLIRETDALDGITRYEYDKVNNLTAIIDRNGHRTNYRYDDLNRQIEMQDALNQVSRQNYDLANNLIATTDERGHTTQYRYDARDRLTQVLHPAPFENESLTYSYDDVGNLRFVTDELGRTTEYVYDALNRQVEMIDPREHKTAYGYDANDNLTRVTDALLQTTSYEYDALNRQRVRTDDLGETQITGYDASSNVTSFTDELKRTTTFSYDGRNLRTQVTDPLKHTVTTTYDLLGRMTSEKNHLGHTTSYLYDLLDRVTQVSDATIEATQYEYDPVGNLTALIDAENNRTSYVYDELNRVQEETTTFGTRLYGYDEVGNQTRITDRNGRVRTFDYDERDRLTQESWLDGTGVSIYDVDYTYNAASELTRVSDAFSQYAYQYNLNGFVTQVDNLGTPNLPNVVFDYRYNAVNNLESVTDRWNGQMQGIEEYRYDPLNRVSRITQSGTNVSDKRVDFVYDAASQMETVSRYSGLDTTNLVVQSDHGFDAAGRLESLVHERVGNAIAFYNWQYDAANRITRVESIDGVSNYTYNDRDELTASVHSYQVDEDYDYDGTGNRINAGYETGQHNRLLNDGTYSYIYDNEGNRITRTAIASGTVDEYTWDYRNRLTAIVTKDADGNVIKTAEYTYDVYDRRIEKVVDSDGDGAAAPETERYIYDGDHIALVFDGEGNQTHRYFHGPQIDQVLAEETADGEVRWALADNQGTIRDVIDNDGNVINHISYDSFGQVTEQTNPTAFFRFGYTGREFDQESGQYYYRARYFDPGNGRFISEDPIGFNAGDANIYRYVENSPTLFIDPSGLQILTDQDTGLNNPQRLPLGGSFGGSFRGSGIRPTGGRFTGGGFKTAPPTRHIPPRNAYPSHSVPTTGNTVPGVGLIDGLNSPNNPSNNHFPNFDQIDDAVNTKQQNQRIHETDDATDDCEQICPDDFSTQTGDTSRNATILRENMTASGIIFQEGEQAHHIVPSTHRRGVVARAILDKYCIDINDADNGVNLPHHLHHGKGLHSYDGIDKVTSMLGRAQNEAQVRQVLRSMARKQRQGKFLP